MKKIGVLVMMLAAAVSGCAWSSAHETAPGTAGFQQAKSGAKIAQGTAELRIKASLKTHEPGAHAIPDVHGRPEYKLLLKIDGNEVPLSGTLSKERSEPVKLVDPEAGVGIRHTYSTTLRLTSGAHAIAAALPEDDVSAQREITLAEGEVNQLVLEPVYSAEAGMKRSFPYTATTYKNGIRSIRMILNGREVRQCSK